MSEANEWVKFVSPRGHVISSIYKLRLPFLDEIFIHDNLWAQLTTEYLVVYYLPQIPGWDVTHGPLRACLHEGGGTPGRWGNPPSRGQKIKRVYGKINTED